MISNEEMKKVLDDACIRFICNQYDSFKDGFYLPYPENISQAIMFDEYVRTLSDEDIQEWFDDELSEEDFSNVRCTVKEGTDVILRLNHKNIFGGCYA